MDIGQGQVDAVEFDLLVTFLVILNTDGAGQQEVAALFLKALFSGRFAGVFVLVGAFGPSLFCFAVGGDHLHLAGVDKGPNQVIGEDVRVHHISIGAHSYAANLDGRILVLFCAKVVSPGIGQRISDHRLSGLRTVDIIPIPRQIQD